MPDWKLNSRPNIAWISSCLLALQLLACEGVLMTNNIRLCCLIRKIFRIPKSPTSLSQICLRCMIRKIFQVPKSWICLGCLITQISHVLKSQICLIGKMLHIPNSPPWQCKIGRSPALSVISWSGILCCGPICFAFASQNYQTAKMEGRLWPKRNQAVMLHFHTKSRSPRYCWLFYG